MAELVIIAMIAVAFYLLTQGHAPPVPDPEPPEEDPEPPKPPFTVGRYTGLRLTHRNEHHLVVAPTGHGKTEWLKTMLLEDLPKKQAMVVFDTKGDLIDDLIKKRALCTERTVLIDPRDVEHPFNLGFIDFARMQRLPPLEKEIAYNGAIDLLTLTLGSLDAEMTTKQETLFGMLFRLLEKVPDASVLTLLEILKRDSRRQFQPYINQLDGLYRSFFEDMYYGGREYNETKDQVARRLYDILNNPVLRQAFTDPHPRFDMQQALRDRKIILINLSTQVLKGFAPTFGRFMMARVLQAVEERRDRTPVIVYADEALDYLDASTDRILRKARSANLGLVLFVQSIGRIPAELRDTVLSQTLIKTVGRLTTPEVRQIQATTKVTVEEERVKNMDAGTVLTYSHRPLSCELAGSAYQVFNAHWSRGFIGTFDRELEPSTEGERKALRERMRQLYAVEKPPPEEKDVVPDGNFDHTKAERWEE